MPPVCPCFGHHSLHSRDKRISLTETVPGRERARIGGQARRTKTDRILNVEWRQPPRPSTPRQSRSHGAFTRQPNLPVTAPERCHVATLALPRSRSRSLGTSDPIANCLLPTMPPLLHPCMIAPRPCSFRSSQQVDTSNEAYLKQACGGA